MLTIDHQSGKLQFEVERAVYAIEDGKFSCSIECAANPAHAGLDAPVFSFLRYPLQQNLAVGSELVIAGKQEERDDFDEPSTHWYSGSHADPWNARLRVLALDGDRLEAEVSFECSDPLYYDARAKPVRVLCRASFRRVEGADVRQLM